MEDRLLYHIMDYQNLYSILETGFLSAHSLVVSKSISYADIAHKSIQNKRSVTPVQAYPYGMLHNYVPFYFAPRSPMLFAIDREQVDGYSGAQNSIIYLITRTDKIQNAGKDFVFTDGHAIMQWTEFYNDLNHLDQLDWEVMRAKYWRDTEEDPDRKRRRQAEFLVYQSVELDLLLGIGVRNERMKNTVLEILKRAYMDLRVFVRPQFYY